MIRLICLLCLCILFAPGAKAGQNITPDFDYAAFSRLPVQHQGRLKPIDTFARLFLYNFSGKENLNGESAEAWLAQTLFDPGQAMQQEIFRVFRPGLLGLPDRVSKSYSYIELAGALQSKSDVLKSLANTEDKFWTEDQRELVRLQEMSMLYTQLLRSFSFVLPLNIALPETLAQEWKLDPQKPFTAQDYRRYQKRLEKKVGSIVAKKGSDPARYSEDEQNIIGFAFQMQSFEQAGQDNILLRIVPGQKEGMKGEWFSPWALMESGQASPESADYLDAWKAMAHAYAGGDEAGWLAATEKTASLYPADTRLGLEIIYNSYHPLIWAMGFYLLAFFCFAGWQLTNRSFFKHLSFAALAGGAAFNALAILLRILILTRPPVGTLYESILFVAGICALIALILEFFRKDGSGLIAGSVSGLVLLFVAEGFAEDDTMKMLVAVLNTNFWLGTHVLCITMGYGLCLIAAFLAHLWMVREMLGQESQRLTAPIKTLCLIALLFTAIGTILGGIWADQSWGRFWGWDPKENGALLIVLWLIWILHGALSGHLKGALFMAGVAGLSIIVMLAWFGVNLLSVGLHSYGFISGIALGLGLYCALDMALIGALLLKIRQRTAA